MSAHIYGGTRRKRDKDGFEFCAPGCWNIVDHTYNTANGQKTIKLFNFLCPCGCGAPLHLTIATGPKQDGAWEWDGNEAAPTLNPSILIYACKWHGWFQAGKWNYLANECKLADNCVDKGRAV